jgi:nucleolar pre-ribosomal-associated protein 1
LRILIIAFQKLATTLEEFKRASGVVGGLWDQAAQQLVTAFCQRCPQMGVIMNVFRKTSHDNVMQREAVTRLLRLYYEVISQVALNEKFDVSIPLCKALAGAESGEELSDDQYLRVLELEHLVQIARHSPNMRWWQKPGMCILDV